VAARFGAPRLRGRAVVGLSGHDGQSRRSAVADQGTSIVEVVVSVVILSIFGIAAMMTVSQGAVTSADNRARIGAAGLAQRELDEAGTKIAASAEGASELIEEGLVANPNPQAVVSGTGSGATTEYGFSMDGQRYRVERKASLYDNGLKSPCSTLGVGAQAVQGTLVTVTVTWEGMSAGAKPHVASKVFPPHPDAVDGLADGKAQIIITVTGDDGSGVTGLLQGIKVSVAGPGSGAAAITTNDAGCAVFVVTPAAGGSEYEVTLDGYAGAGQYVYSNGAPNPTYTMPLSPGERGPHKFPDYSLSGRVTVELGPTSPPPVDPVVVLEPMWAAGAPMSAELVEGKALFEPVAPGTYSVVIDGVSVEAVFVAAGAVETKTVETVGAP
jgi:type II secretory pathway pseudopilin PulG